MAILSATWPTMTGAGTTTTGAVMIPDVWADEVLAFREANLVAADAVKRINHKGKKGDAIYFPTISELVANTKTAATAVTVQTWTEGKKTLNLTTHQEVSFLIEDILKVQSKYDLRQEYTKAAGYALAKAIDTSVLSLYSSLNATYKVTGADGVTAYAAGNEGDLTDAAIRQAIELLDNNNVPANDRTLIIPPSQKNVLLGIDKFTLYQNIGRTNELQKGLFGEIYGMKVKVTTNCQTTGNATVAMLLHKDAIGLALQQDVRVQAQYKQEFLGWLVTADVIYGAALLRGDASDDPGSNYRKSHAVALYVPT